MKLRRIFVERPAASGKSHLGLRLTRPFRQSLRAIVVSIVLFGSVPASAETDWGKMIADSFDALGSNLETIETKTAGYTTNGWYRSSVTEVTAAGAAACSIPGVGMGAVVVELPYLMREMYNSSVGLGFLINKTASDEDFANILAAWAGELNLDKQTLMQIKELVEEAAQELGEQAIEKIVDRVMEKLKENRGAIATIAAGTAPATASQAGTATTANSAASGVATSGAGAAGSTVGTKATTKIATKTAAKLSSKAGAQIASKVVAKKFATKVAGKLGAKVTAKVGTKIAGKVATKGFASWIPLLGAAACGGINTWIMSSLLDSAIAYYELLASVFPPEQTTK